MIIPRTWIAYFVLHTSLDSPSCFIRYIIINIKIIFQTSYTGSGGHQVECVSAREMRELIFSPRVCVRISINETKLTVCVRSGDKALSYTGDSRRMLFEFQIERSRKTTAHAQCDSGISVDFKLHAPIIFERVRLRNREPLSGWFKFISNWKRRETFVLVARESLAFVLSYNFIISSILGGTFIKTLVKLRQLSGFEATGVYATIIIYLRGVSNFSRDSTNNFPGIG